MTKPFPLPQKVSNDGREIWDWAARVGRVARLHQEIRELSVDVSQMKRECGSCFHWMKSKSCPRETNIGGRRVRPSMGAPICAKFQMCPSSAKIIGEKTARIEACRAELAAELAAKVTP